MVVVINGAWFNHFVPQQVGAVRLRVRAPGGLRPADHFWQDHEAHPAHGRGSLRAGLPAGEVPAAACHASYVRAAVAAFAAVAASAEAGPGLRRVMSTVGLLSVGSRYDASALTLHPNGVRAVVQYPSVYGLHCKWCVSGRSGRAVGVNDLRARRDWGPGPMAQTAQSAGSLAFVLILKTRRVAAPRRPARPRTNGLHLHYRSYLS